MPCISDGPSDIKRFVDEVRPSEGNRELCHHFSPATMSGHRPSHVQRAFGVM